MAADEAWTAFIQRELLQADVVSGVAVVTKQAQCVYTFGSLQPEAPADTWCQFCGIFDRATEKHHKKICNSVFSIPVEEEVLDFRVVRKTLSSLYGTSSGGCDGLIVCNIANGVLICHHQRPECMGEIISTVENFANLLRR